MEDALRHRQRSLASTQRHACISPASEHCPQSSSRGSAALTDFFQVSSRMWLNAQASRLVRVLAMLSGPMTKASCRIWGIGELPAHSCIRAMAQDDRGTTLQCCVVAGKHT